MKQVTNTPLGRTLSTYRVKPRLQATPISRLTGHSAHRSSLCSSEVMSSCLASRPFQVQVPLLPQASKQLTPHPGLLLKRHPSKKPSSLPILSQNNTFPPSRFLPHICSIFFPLATPTLIDIVSCACPPYSASASTSVPSESELPASPVLPYPKFYQQSGHTAGMQKVLVKVYPLTTVH